jgi:hypothetical protein
MTEDTSIPPSDDTIKRGAAEVALVISAAANLVGAGAHAADVLAKRSKPPEPPKIILPPGSRDE